MRRDAFTAKGLRIESWRSFDGRVFVCWRPDVSVYCRSRKEVLKFASWPIKTPTGDSLRGWLDGIEQMDAERVNKKAEPLTREAPDVQTSPSLSQELLATGFGPEVFAGDDDPTANTRMIT